MENETDNLNHEGLDLLILENNNKKISINPIYYSNKTKEEEKEVTIQKKQKNSNCLIN